MRHGVAIMMSTFSVEMMALVAGHRLQMMHRNTETKTNSISTQTTETKKMVGHQSVGQEVMTMVKTLTLPSCKIPDTSHPTPRI